MAKVMENPNSLIGALMGSDPVFSRIAASGLEWNFWDETWSNIHGPYDTEEEARAALDEYTKNL